MVLAVVLELTAVAVGSSARGSSVCETVGSVSGAALTALECECERLQLLHFNRR